MRESTHTQWERADSAQKGPNPEDRTCILLTQSCLLNCWPFWDTAAKRSWFQSLTKFFFSFFCIPFFRSHRVSFLDISEVFGSQAVSLPGKKLISMSSNELFSSTLNWKSKVVQMHLNEDLRAFRKTQWEYKHVFFSNQIKGTNLLAWSPTAKSLKDHESRLNWTAVAEIFPH